MNVLSTQTSRKRTSANVRDKLLVALPPPDMSMPQDAEWCVVRVDDEWKQVRFHDYSALYAIPGLYERVIYTLLGCDSPRTVRELLQSELADAQVRPQDLRVLDLGAGNGIVGEELTELGVPFVVGVDIIDEAKRAAQRDRPGIYDHYHVLDMAALDQRMSERFGSYDLNALTCVAALGFGDIPIQVFAAAYNLIAVDGFIAFNIKEDFLSDEDESGFAALLRRMHRHNVISLGGEKRYVHRRATSGQALHYVAMVGRKRCDVPLELLEI